MPFSERAIFGERWEYSFIEYLCRREMDLIMQEKITLDNGIRILLDPLDYVRSASFGIWIESGSIHEEKGREGISHFIEHMAFKGTEKRTAMDIASDFDNIGGQANAFTAKEMTCFYAKTLDTNVMQGFEILSDIILNSSLSDKNIEIEKKVIFEEIAMEEDNPEDLAIDRFCESVWLGHPLANRILGYRDTIKGFNSELLRNHIVSHYQPQNIIITISGSYNKDEFVKFADSAFSNIKSSVNAQTIPKAKFIPQIILEKKKTEQNHICIGFESFDSDSDEESNALALFSIVFGSGLSSRLFQRIREETGLVYTIYSFPLKHRQGGLFCIYAGLNSNTEGKALKLIYKEINDVIKNGITNEELQRAKEQFKASVVMGLEGTSSRMAYMGRNEIVHGRVKSMAETISEIDNKDINSVMSAAKKVFNFEKSAISVIGKPKTEDYYKSLLY